MAIAKKPKKTQPSEKAIDAFIDKGGNAASKKKERAIVPVQLRMPSEMLDEVDAVIESRPYKQSRHTWLLEAVFEKIEREKQANG